MTRFMVPEAKDDEFYWNIIDTENDNKVILQHISIIQTRELCGLLNALDAKSKKDESREVEDG